MLERLTRLNNTQLRFLVAGGFNTLFGYFCGIALFYLLRAHVGVFLIGVVSNIIAISMSFVVYKLFVFRTRGRWLYEYCRSYVVYGTSALISVGLFWLTVGQMHLPVWLAQGITIVVVALIGWFGNAKFTFRHRQ